jgi:hypothetical protein
MGQYSYPAGYSKFTGGGIREQGQTYSQIAATL